MSGGRDLSDFDSLRSRVAIGSTAFRERARTLVSRLAGEQPDRTFAERMVPFDQVISTVAAHKAEPWASFRDRQGDWGRDMVLYLARQRSGMTLRELGECAGGLDYKTAGKAIERMQHRLKNNRELRHLADKFVQAMSTVVTLSAR